MKKFYIRVSAKQMRLFQLLISFWIAFFLIAFMDGNIWKEFIATTVIFVIGTAVFLEIKYRSSDYVDKIPDDAEIIHKNLWTTNKQTKAP